jgi:hypothetical protein
MYYLYYIQVILPSTKVMKKPRRKQEITLSGKVQSFNLATPLSTRFPLLFDIRSGIAGTSLKEYEVRHSNNTNTTIKRNPRTYFHITNSLS